MKIVKPLTLGLLHRPYSQAQRHHLVVCALGFFALGKPVPTRLLGEAAQWPQALAALPAGQPLDEVMPKAQAEALVVGAACALQPSLRLHVRLRLGPIDKRLVACGPRASWRDVDTRIPVQRVPLDHQLAWGAADFDDNPIGCGASGKDGPLPQWAYPDTELTETRRSTRVAGLGPRCIGWAPRRRHAGTYDAAWLRDHHPGLPLDLDWRTYNQAAEDQRLTGPHFSGGEPYQLEGMHPQQPLITGALPTQRARAFVLRDLGLDEVPLAMDTVWFFPEQGLGIVAWRGQIEVDDSDALDVRALMLAYEAAEQAARPLTQYAAVLAQRLDPVAGAAAAFNESQLAPARNAAELAIDAERDAQAAQAAAQRQTQTQASLRAEIEQHFGAPLPEPPTNHPARKPVPHLPAPSPSAMAAGDFDLGALIEGCRALAAQTRAEGSAQRDELLSRVADRPTEPPAAPALPSQAELSCQVQFMADAERAKARRAAPEPFQPALPPELARWLGQQALVWIAQGHSLAGRDLASADLRGAQLAGQDLRGCLLEWADLRGANLRGCLLDDAVLARARLEQADLTGAQLSGANLSHAAFDRAKLAGAVLQQARASHAQFCGADVSGADFSQALLDATDFSSSTASRARLDGSLLNKADLRDSCWTGAQFNRCVGWRLQAQGADFSGSSWTRSALVDANLAASRWCDATLSQLQGGNSGWEAAVLCKARAERCGWPAARMAGADLSQGLFAACDFSRVDLRGSRLEGGCFPRSIFIQARMSGLLAYDADFFQALLRKADLSGADLREASLVQAELTEVQHSGAQLHGLRLDARRAWA